MIVFEFIRINKNLGKDRLWTFSLPTHKLSNLLLLLKTPAGTSSIWFHLKLLRKKDTWWILVEHFWNALQSDNKSRLAWKLVLTELVNHKSFLKWRVNRDQTNITFDVYKLFTRRPARSCFWRLQLVSSLSGFDARFYDKTHIKFITIFQRYLCSLCHSFPGSLSFFFWIDSLFVSCPHQTHAYAWYISYILISINTPGIRRF